MLSKLSLFYHLFLLHRLWAKAPSPWVCIPLHYDALNFCDNSVVASRQFHCRHLSDGKGNGLTLCGHEDDLFVHRYVGLISQEPRNHQFGSIADGVDGAVFDDNTLVADQEALERTDDTA